MGPDILFFTVYGETFKTLKFSLFSIDTEKIAMRENDLAYCST